jgi:hypothetical protein
MYGSSPVPVGSDAEVKDLLDEEKARKEEKVVTFLNDPEEQLRIFFSSYMRKQGLIWYVFLYMSRLSKMNFTGLTATSSTIRV